MLAVLVLEDEYKVFGMVSRALKDKGYVCESDPRSPGIVKITRAARSRDTKATENVCSINDPLRENKGNLYKTTLAGIEKPLIESVLERTESNQLRAARILGINRNTLRSKMKKLGINPAQWKE